MSVALGIDTSCYTTSAAAVNEAGEVVASARRLLPVADGNRGLRQSEAVFAHVRQLSEVMGEVTDALHAAGQSIAAVCASDKPRDMDESYMPVFTVGAGAARMLAGALDVPLYRASHQRGHIAAGLIGNRQPEGRFIALHLSGGTTELLCCDNDALTIIGGSKDLHAGQLIDRVGVRIGLGFPAGPELEKLAMQGEPSGALPASVEKDGLWCHLSGAEAQLMRLLDAGDASKETVAAEAFDLLARTVSRMLAAAGEKTGAHEALIVGGVASSALLRDMLARRLSRARSQIKLVFGRPEYSADNACGVACIGMMNYLKERGKEL